MLPPVGARTPGLDDLHGPDDAGSGDDHDAPNYLVRRGIAIGAAVVLIAVIAVVVGRLIGAGGDDGAAAAPSADWNAVVVLTADEIRLIDPDSGDLIDTYDAAADQLDAQSLVAGNTLVTMTDAGRIVQTDLTDGTDLRGRAGPDETLWRSPDNPNIAVAGSSVGGDVTVIDTRDRATLSIADVADLDDPLMFADGLRVNPSGTHVATADARTFQSVVVDIVNESAELLAGQVVAIDDERVVTAQRAGEQAELEFYDLQGERLGSVDVPTPATTMLTGDGNLLMVDFDGTIRSANEKGESDEIGQLIDPNGVAIDVTSGRPILNGTRMLVGTERRVFILDDDGKQLGVATGGLPSTATASSRCVVVGSTTTTGSSVQLDADTGAIIVELAGGIVTTTSLDGCTAALIGNDGSQLVRNGEVVDVDANSISAVAPDGTAYTVIDGRDTELIRVDDDAPIELVDEAALIHFADR